MSTATSDPQFLGIQNKFTDVLKFTNAESYDPIPVYRILQPPGQTEDKNLKVNKLFLFCHFYCSFLMP